MAAKPSSNTKNSAPPKGLQTARDIATHLKVTPRTVLYWAEEGKIPTAFRNGRTVRFSLEAVETSLDVNRAGEGNGDAKPTSEGDSDTTEPPHATAGEPSRYAVDEAAIQAYLSLESPEKAAHVLAGMSPQQIDLASSADQALTLLAEARAALLRRREKMAASMSFLTLLLLVGRLGMSAPLKDLQDNIEVLSDPVAGPAARQLLRICPTRFLNPEAPEGTGTATVLSNHEALSGVTRPRLPCDLEEALRYAVHAPHANWKGLKKAYTDYLLISIPFDNEDSQLIFNSLPLEEQLKRSKSAEKRGYKADKSLIPTFLRPDSPDDSGAQLGEPGAPDEEAEAGYSESDLVDLVTGFLPFWSEHGEAYESKARKKSETNAKSAPLSRISDMAVTWGQRVIAFTVHLKDPRLKAPSTIEERDAMLRKFSKTQGSSGHTHKKVLQFMVVLLDSVGQPLTDELMKAHVDQLKSIGIKAVDEDTIRVCMLELGECEKVASLPKSPQSAHTSLNTVPVE